MLPLVRQSMFDQCLFFRSDFAVLVYVDDLFITGTHDNVVSILHAFANSFAITRTAVRAKCDFLSLNINRSPGKAFVLQQQLHRQTVGKVSAIVH